MSYVAGVIAQDGTKLMPTTNPRKVDKGQRWSVSGTKNNGDAVKLMWDGKKVNPSVNSVKRIKRTSGWSRIA